MRPKAAWNLFGYTQDVKRYTKSSHSSPYLCLQPGVKRKLSFYEVYNYIVVLCSASIMQFSNSFFFWSFINLIIKMYFLRCTHHWYCWVSGVIYTFGGLGKGKKPLTKDKRRPSDVTRTSRHVGSLRCVIIIALSCCVCLLVARVECGV